MRSCRRHGFTLIELAIVLAVVSLMTGFGMKVMQATGSSNCYDQTRLQMRGIAASLQNYVRTQSKYPIPARIYVGVTDPTFGKSDDGTHVDTNSDTNTIYIGALPFATLGLPPSYAADCWGNKFRYLVTKTLTTGISAAGAITVNMGTISSNTPLTSTAAYAVISHGSDALGACARNYTAASLAASNCNCNTQQASGSVTRVDKENCDTANATVFSTTFNNGTSAHDYFDDLIIYQSKIGTTSMCLPMDITWNNGGAGTNCASPVGLLADGVTLSLTNSNAGYTGNATVKCSAGVTSLQGSPSPTCTAPSCSAGTVYSWTPCSGPLGSTLANGGTATVTNNASGYNGNAPVKCSGSTLISNGASSCSGNTCSLPAPWQGVTGTSTINSGASVHAYSRANATSLACSCDSFWALNISCSNGTLSGDTAANPVYALCNDVTGTSCY